RPAPVDDRVDRLLGADRTPGGQGRVLADRVPGGGGGLEAGPAQKVGQRDAHEAERGLGVLGQAELLLVRLGQEPAEVDLGAAAPAELGDLGIIEERGAHAGRLGALAGKEEGELARAHRSDVSYLVLVTS